MASATTIQQAFTEAVAEHSPAVSEPTTPASPETTETPAKTDETPAQSPPDPSATPDDLITDARYAELEAQHPDDPKALAKALKAEYTKKTQSLAAERKTVEQHRELITALNDPATRVDTLTALAKQFGLPIGEVAAAKKEAAVVAVVSKATDVFREKLKGTNLEFLADELGPALDAAMRHVAEEVVSPLKADQQSRDQHTAQGETERIWNDFATKHPDWKTHEATMNTLSAKYPPAQGTDAGEYLDFLYRNATHDQQIASGVQAILAKMRAGEKEDPSGRSVPAGHVDVVTPKNPTIREAWEASKAELSARTGVR